MGAGVVRKQGGGRGRRRGRAQPMAEINVTPFVDVMLVLLIIFMVAAPLLTVGVPVELPALLRAAYDPMLPPVSHDSAHALRLFARIGAVQ